MKRILVGILGASSSGKTYTWDQLFGHPVKTGKNKRRLYLTDEEYVKVFLISRSPGKRKMPVEKIITVDHPEIVLCSLQYSPSVITNLKYFHNNGYQFYIQWLNPGFSDENDDPLFYDSPVINQLMKWHALISVRNGKKSPDERLEELKCYLYGWSRLNGYLRQKGGPGKHSSFYK